MKIRLAHIGIGILGIALFGKLFMGDGDISSEAKRNYLKSTNSNSESGNGTWDLMNDNEISIVYAVIKNYGHPNNAPIDLKFRFEAIGRKYNIFT